MVTQLPLEKTRIDFWRMVYEHLGAVIVCLSDIKEDDPEVSQCFPV